MIGILSDVERSELVTTKNLTKCHQFSTSGKRVVGWHEAVTDEAAIVSNHEVDQ
jgi:hypothetical protein